MFERYLLKEEKEKGRMRKKDSEIPAMFLEIQLRVKGLSIRRCRTIIIWKEVYWKITLYGCKECDE